MIATPSYSFLHSEHLNSSQFEDCSGSTVIQENRVSHA